MAELTLAAANTIIAAALEAGTKAGFKPLTVAVLDAGGHLKAFQKQKGLKVDGIGGPQTWVALWTLPTK